MTIAPSEQNRADLLGNQLNQPQQITEKSSDSFEDVKHDETQPRGVSPHAAKSDVVTG